MRVKKMRMITIMRWDEKPERIESIAVPLTMYGQKILDVICDRVTRDAGMGYIGWSIGKKDVVVAYVAEKLAKTPHSVACALAHMIDAGLIDSGGENDDTWMPVKNIISVSHWGWQAYRHWDAKAIVAHYGDGSPPKPISFTEWLYWDGVDCTCIPFYGPKIDW